MSVRKRGSKWYYDFGNHKYRGVIDEARTKREAEQAEVVIKRAVFEGKYGVPQATRAAVNATAGDDGHPARRLELVPSSLAMAGAMDPIATAGEGDVATIATPDPAMLSGKSAASPEVASGAGSNGERASCIP